LRFTVHRPPRGEVSLCCHRPSGGDVAGGVDVGVARPRVASNAHEDRLALAVFGRDVPAGGALLRRVRGRDPFESARGLVVEPSNQPTPGLTADCAVEPALLRNPNTGLRQCAAPRAGHRPHVKTLDSNGVESACQIGAGLFHPVSASVRFSRFEFRNCELSALSAIRAALGPREALLQPTQTNPLALSQVRHVEQLSGRQGRRNHHAAIDTDHAAVPGRWDRIGDVGKGDVPAAASITSNAVRLHPRGNRPALAKSDPPDFGHPQPPIAPVDFLHLVWLEPHLPETFIHPGFAPGRTPMGAGEEVLHGLGEVAQRLLLYRCRSGRQPLVFGTDFGQLRAMLRIPGDAASWLPQLLLLDGQIPHKPGMPAMLRQHRLLCWRWQQPKPRHSRKVSTATDNEGRHKPVHLESGIYPRERCRSVHVKECR
jgi:hypothetical protein